MITNFCILNNIKSNKDRFCISVRIKRYDKNILILEVRNDDQAPYINYTKHSNKFNIINVREGVYPDIHLLSGGLLIFEKNDFALALGKRNKNSVDPLCWTNIASGRCDHFWEQHILEELTEEFLLYFKKSRKSYVSLIPEIAKDPDSILKYQQSIFPKITEYEPLNFTIDQSGDFLHLNQKSFWKKVQIYWPDKLDEFEAIVFYDEKNRTFEIRQPAVVDLSNYNNLKLLFPEGDKEADWFPISDLKYQRQKEVIDGKQRFVPFMQFFLDNI